MRSSKEEKELQFQNAPKVFLKLHVFKKDKKINVININGKQGKLSLGHEKDNDLQIENMFVGKHHAKLVVLLGKVIFDIIDVRKTFLNQQKLGVRSSDLKDYIGKVEIMNGDVITIGKDLHFQVEIEGKEKDSKNQQRELQNSKIPLFDAYRKNDLEVEVENINGKGKIIYHGKEVVEQKKEKTPNEVVEPKKEKEPAPVVEPKKEKKEEKLPGDIIPGYEKIKQIGRGGMGEVYLVKERKTGKQMALKRIISDTAVTQKEVDYFIREAYLHIQLNHKNVAKVHKVAPFESSPYILMEYYKDGTIIDYVLQNKNNPQIMKLLRDALIQILEGLDYLHHLKLDVYAKGDYEKPIHVKGLVHRDIKPENIFVEYDKNGKATMKIADMGLAKSFQLAGFSNMTQQGALLGTLQFMCKQQLTQTIYSKPEVDIWAAVASIYMFITGRLPKPIEPNDPPNVVIDKILLCPSVPIQLYNPTVSPQFAQIIDRALNDSGKLYYQNAKDLIKDLKKVKL